MKYFRMSYEEVVFRRSYINIMLLNKAIPNFKSSSKDAEDGSFTIMYLGDGATGFRLELTWLRDHPQPYNLGECEFHLAFRADDFEAAHKRHEEMGCICFENHKMGIYFVMDPDGYWVEVIPTRK